LDWAPLYTQLKRMEMRGEVRRGYFVEGLPGIQFALPEAVERLREWNSPEAAGAEDLVLLNACDPANLFGPASGLEVSSDEAHDPARFTRIPSNNVVLLRGRPVLLLELGGERLTGLTDLPIATLKRALRLALDHLSFHQRRLTIREWNGKTILDSPAAPLLEELGFHRDALVYIRDQARRMEP
jgi:ATP-dependent Lhr-like helicase